MIYVDELRNVVPKGPRARRNGTGWCHMWADSEAELLTFAEYIGLKKEWAQRRPRLLHFDLTPAKRELALDNGAIPTDLKDWFKMRREE